MTTNSDLQARVKWPVYWAQCVLRCFRPIDSDEFAEAVYDWQARYGLDADGLLGRDTYGSMRYQVRDHLRSDVDWLARIISAEMSSRSGALDIEAECVGWTVINRLVSPRYAWTVERIARGRGYAVASRSEDFRPDTRSRRLAMRLLREHRVDPTDGCTHFYSPRSMPSFSSPEWPGEEHAKPRQYYREGEQYFLWTGKRRINTSTHSWVTLADDTGRMQTRAAPKFASGMEHVEVGGVREWWARFFRESTS